MLNIERLPDYFRAYAWCNKHALYGYPGDTYPEFPWIASLEARFRWLERNCTLKGTASRYLIQEMIQWGGSQNGVLQKFEDGIGEVNLYVQVKEAIRNIATPSAAIESALKLPGMGLTYASKMLRFIDPHTYGALDSRVRNVLDDRIHLAIPKISDGNTKSIIDGYVAFTKYLANLRKQLDSKAIMRPECNLPHGSSPSLWRAADIEMALFRWAESDKS